MNNKLNNLNAALKTYWTTLNCFFYKTKIPAIPPLLSDGNFVYNSCEKANLFKNIFAKSVR